MNVIFIRGRLTQDPDLRTTPQGKAVCSLNLAVNRYVKGNEKETMYIKVTAWDKVAENCGRHLVKGQDILVQGSACPCQRNDSYSEEQTDSFEYRRIA